MDCVLYVPDLGTYVKSCDTDANDGRGSFTFADDINEALHFDGFISAMDYWKRQSTITPFRPDGKPNRPLTSFTVIPTKV